MSNARVGGKVMGFFNPISTNDASGMSDMYAVKEINAEHIQLTDESLVKQYRDQERVIRIKKLLANFFNVKDDYAIGGLYSFYDACESAFAKRNDIKLFFKEQEHLLGLNSHCGKNREQLSSLALCIYGCQEAESFDCTQQAVEFVKANLYEEIEKIKREVSGIKHISKDDLLAQGTCSIHKKHINLNGHFSKFSVEIKTQAKQLIIESAKKGDFETIASVSQMLVTEKWYEAYQLVNQYQPPNQSNAIKCRR